MTDETKAKKPRRRKTQAEKLEKATEAQLGKMRAEATATLEAVAGEVKRRKEALDKL